MDEKIVDMITREANENDWDKLLVFFIKIYRKKHPLQNRDFWQWQYGNPKYGRSFICLNENEEIVGHIGIGIEGGISWMLNAYLDENYRGKGIMDSLFNLAGKHGSLAATGASELGLTMFKNRNWIRYYNLLRYVKVNPNLNHITTKNVCKKVIVSIENLILADTHYFQQPGIKGLVFEDGSRAVSQEEVGGLRIVDFNNIKWLEKKAWDLGYLWLDYLTSWNDFKIKELENNDWVLDYKSVVPWLLNPVQENVFCNVSHLSEYPLDREFIVHRSFSDHGRIGSL